MVFAEAGAPRVPGDISAAGPSVQGLFPGCDGESHAPRTPFKRRQLSHPQATGSRPTELQGRP